MSRCHILVLGVLFAAQSAVAEPLSITVDPSQIHVTAIPASLAPIGTADGMTGMAAQFDGLAPPALRTGGTALYDNIPTIFGGTGTPGAGTWAFFNAANDQSEWGDYVSLAATGTISTLQYIYANVDGQNTQSIRFYSAINSPPSVGGTFTGIGSLVANIIVPSLPSTTPGFFILTITQLSIPALASDLYIGFEDINGSGSGTGGTFWLTGGFPGIGMSTDLIVTHDPLAGISTAFPGPLYTGEYPFHGNINFTLKTPAPVSILLPLMGSVLVLRKRQ